MSFIDKVLESIPIPRVVRVRQRFDRPRIDCIADHLLEKLENRGVWKTLKRGMRVAITGGSRGISNLPLIIKALSDRIKASGADPFVFPAMGSHGGATAQGQKKMLATLGLTEEYLGVPVLSSMETIQIGTTANGLPVFVDALAWAADGIVIVNRIKPHVGFRGKYESGLVKMLAIGLGKQRGAEICHQLGFGKMEENIVSMAVECLSKGKVLFGIGIVENPYHETCKIEVWKPEEILRAEPGLLAEAKGLLPKIHLNPLDVLVLDEIGKDIGGTGFDNNVVGRFHTPFIQGDALTARITRIIALDLSDKTHGNGNGLGILDFTTHRAFKKFDFEQTYPNCLTSTVPQSVKIPMVLKNDRQAIQAAIKTCNILDFKKVRLARVKNTLSLDVMEISENMVDEARQNLYVDVLSEPYELQFDSHGNLF